MGSPSSNSSSNSKHPSSSLGSSSSPSSSSRGSHPGGQTTLIPEDANQLLSSSSSLSQAHRRQLTFSKLRLRSRRQSGCRAVWQTQELLDVNSRHPPLVKSK